MAYGNGDTTGRNTNAIVPNMVDRGPWQFWDTITVTAGSTLSANYYPFSVPIGAPNPLVAGNPSKTKLQTNMQLGNQFSPPKCLLLMQIGFYFSSRMFKGDIDLIFDNSYLEFKIDDKVFHEGQMWQFPAGVGMTGFTSQSGIGFFTNGLVAPEATRRYNSWAKYIAPLQLFNMTIYFPGTPPTLDANGVGWYSVPFLDGLTDRSVQ